MVKVKDVRIIEGKFFELTIVNNEAASLLAYDDRRTYKVTIISYMSIDRAKKMIEEMIGELSEMVRELEGKVH